MNSIWKVRPIGDLLLICVTSGEPADVDLGRGLDLHRRRVVNRGLVYCFGNPVLTPAQRKRSTEAMGSNPSVILTDSALTRGVITAMAWFGSKMIPMSTSELRQGITRIGIPHGFTIEQVETEMLALKSEVNAEVIKQGPIRVSGG